MRKFFSYVFLMCLIILCSNPANATLLDSYFGINLSIDGNGNFNNSWTPTPTNADYIEGNWNTTEGAPNPSPFGSRGEAFDVEAIYFDNDATYAYIAIVTSVPVTGYAGSLFGYPSQTFIPGDIAIDLNSNDPAFNYQYGIKTIGTSTGAVEKNATWVYDKGNAGYQYGYPNQGFLQTPKFNLGSGISMGDASYFNYYDANLTERQWATWVIEAQVLLSVLDNPGTGSLLRLRWSPDCNNDLLFLNGDIDRNLVPEPSTLMLLGAGLLGLFVFKKNKFF